jgi:uroporphyrinogen III methyltransferase/synthase
VDLAGKRVLVTRPKGRSSELTSLLEGSGATAIEVPTIAIDPPDSWERADEAISNRDSFDWLAFNSAAAVAGFFERANSLDVPPEAFRHKIAVVGGATSRAVERHGLRVRLRPATSNAVQLAEELGAGDGRRILIPRAEEVPSNMKEMLQRSGWFAQEVPVYRTVTAPRDPRHETVRRGEFDVVTFASGSTARGFAELFGPPEDLGLDPSTPGGPLVASIGPVTTAAARNLGYRVDVTASEQSDAGLVEAIRGVGRLTT